MLKIKAENNLKRSIGNIIDLEKIAWNAFEFVDNVVPVESGRLRQSATLTAGTNMLLHGGLPKHFATLMAKGVVSLTYSTPKSVGPNANRFYLYGSGHWFDYAYRVEEKQNYLVSNIKDNIAWIISSAIRQK